VRILMLSTVVPFPPHDGDRMRLFHFLRQLRLQGHEVDLFCLSRVPEDASNAERLKPWLHHLHVEHLSTSELIFNLVGGVFHEKSWNTASYLSLPFQAALERYAKGPEGAEVQALFAYRLRMAPYASFFVEKRQAAHPSAKRSPWVLDLVDCLADYTKQASTAPGFPISRKLSSRWDADLLAVEETAWVGRADASLVVAETEREKVIRLGGAANRVWTVPNGVDPVKTTKSPRPEEYPRGGVHRKSPIRAEHRRGPLVRRKGLAFGPPRGTPRGFHGSGWETVQGTPQDG
jgi:glycosyltransferase involved in cell wall biosynthesis